MLESKHVAQIVDLSDPCVSARAVAPAAQSLPVLPDMFALRRGSD